MKVPLNWLNDYVAIENLDPDEVGRRLTLGLCEVEKVEKPSVPFSGVSVGEILEVTPHPEADRLRLAQVTLGQEEPLSIVCGAPNIAPGQKVPVAVIGAKLPTEDGGTFKIKKSKIRGVASQGMLCSPKELGVSDDHEGILILDEDTPLGQKLEETPHFEGPGALLDIDNKSLTHRPDCWGWMGLARELGAILDVPFKSYEDLGLFDLPKTASTTVNNQNQEACPRYHALKVVGLEVKSSPESWVKKLESAGLRAINNIVDATNLVLLEIGQPLHAFDARHVADESIEVRLAQEGESLLTLDDISRELSPEDLVIADSTKPLALAGIMGGEGSSVGKTTTEILLEGASFEAGRIRRSSLRHGLRTDSSARFEKGLPPWLVEIGLRRCLYYLSESCPQVKVVTGLGEAFAVEATQINTSLEKINSRLGCDLSQKDVTRFLTQLGFSIKEEGNSFLVTVPPWRSSKDLSIEEDVIEEVGRLRGFNNLKPQLPERETEPATLPQERQWERGIRRVLADRCGGVEVLKYSFISDKRCAQLGVIQEDLYRVKNPVQEDHASLRPTLLGGLLDAVAVNHRSREVFHYFEIGRVFLPSEDEIPEQKRRVAACHRQEERSFHSGKRALEALLAHWNITKFEWKRADNPPVWCHPGRAAELVVRVKKNQVAAAVLAEVHPKLLKEEGVLGRVAAWELDLSFLFQIPHQVKTFSPIVKYPPVTRDLALVVEESVSVDEVIRQMRRGRKWLVMCELFDIYRGKGLEENKKSLAFHLSWQDPQKTLTDEEVDSEETKLIKQLASQGWMRR